MSLESSLLQIAPRGTQPVATPVPELQDGDAARVGPRGTGACSLGPGGAPQAGGRGEAAHEGRARHRKILAVLAMTFAHGPALDAANDREAVWRGAQRRDRSAAVRLRVEP